MADYVYSRLIKILDGMLEENPGDIVNILGTVAAACTAKGNAITNNNPVREDWWLLADQIRAVGRVAEKLVG